MFFAKLDHRPVSSTRHWLSCPLLSESHESPHALPNVCKNKLEYVYLIAWTCTWNHARVASNAYFVRSLFSSLISCYAVLVCALPKHASALLVSRHVVGTIDRCCAPIISYPVRLCPKIGSFCFAFVLVLLLFTCRILCGVCRPPQVGCEWWDMHWHLEWWICIFLESLKSLALSLRATKKYTYMFKDLLQIRRGRILHSINHLVSSYQGEESSEVFLHGLRIVNYT